VHLPIYLETDVAEFLQELSERTGTEVEKIVNDWLRKDIALVQSTR
jgi:hypothetical protein